MPRSAEAGTVSSTAAQTPATNAPSARRPADQWANRMLTSSSRPARQAREGTRNRLARRWAAISLPRPQGGDRC
jgi:hypothetical protein